MSSQLYTFLFSILDFIINNSQLLLLLTNTDDYDLIQNINAENDIENRDNDSNNPTISINRNLVDNDNDVVVGAWAPINNSFILQHLKGEKQTNAIHTLLN